MTLNFDVQQDFTQTGRRHYLFHRHLHEHVINEDNLFPLFIIDPQDVLQHIFPVVKSKSTGNMCWTTPCGSMIKSGKSTKMVPAPYSDPRIGKKKKGKKRKKARD